MKLVIKYRDGNCPLPKFVLDDNKNIEEIVLDGIACWEKGESGYDDDGEFTKVIYTGDKKECTKCHERKPAEEFYPASRNKTDGLQTQCIECKRLERIERRKKREAE